MDADGKPTTDPSLAEVLMPIAGPKGSGLSIMLECLTSIMIGFPKLEEVFTKKEKAFGLLSIAENPQLISRHSQNSLVAAIDIK